MYREFSLELWENRVVYVLKRLSIQYECKCKLNIMVSTCLTWNNIKIIDLCLSTLNVYLIYRLHVQMT